MSDHHVDLPFSAEYAKSSRAGCKSCGDNIEKDTLRLAIMVQVRLSRFSSVTGKLQECVDADMATGKLCGKNATNSNANYCC